MSRTARGRLTGAAGATELAEQRAELFDTQLREMARKRKQETDETCQKIADILGTREYQLWWKSAPEKGFLRYVRETLARLRQGGNVSYKDRHVPGHTCPHCGLVLTVNETAYKTTDPDHPLYQRRLVCPSFFTNGCRYKEKWSLEIEALLIEADIQLASQPAEF